MNQRDAAFIQGMLDAREEYRSADICNNSVAINPFEDGTEDDLRESWLAGYNAHREPRITDL